MRARVSKNWNSWMNSQKIEVTSKDNACPCCGGPVDTPPSTPSEIAVSVLCLVLLLTIAIPAFWVTEQWIERQGHRVLDRMIIWREPVDSWNL